MWKKTTKKEKNVDFFQEKVGNPDFDILNAKITSDHFIVGGFLLTMIRI